MNDITTYDSRVEQFDATQPVSIGDWFWYNPRVRPTFWDSDKYREQYDAKGCPDEDYFMLVCVTHIGSNYFNLEHPNYKHDHSTWSFDERCHFNEFAQRTIRVENPEKTIRENLAFYETRHNYLLSEVNELTKQLGVNNDPHAIEHKQDANAQALSVVSDTVDVDAYKNALIKTRDDVLPAKFEAIKRNSGQLAKWMTATMLSMQSTFGDVKGAIDKRLFSISLYAGFGEVAQKFKDGAPAAIDEPLHVFQRMLYMDEECLLDYTDGGMDFSQIDAFGEWLSRPHNMERVFPRERCLVAFKVRRHKKEYGDLHWFIKMGFDQKNQWTFLYFRNGEQLWLVQTDIQFDEFIVPDDKPLHFGDELMFGSEGGSSSFITRNDYEVRCAQWEENQPLYEAFDKEETARVAALEKSDPDGWHRKKSNPYASSFNKDDWKKFDDDDLYFDDGWAHLSAEGEKHNKIGLILQGIIDRTDILQPFNRVKLWDPASFDKAIKLVRDGRGTIHHGKAPDIEAYFKKLNDAIDKGSVVSGQKKHYWAMVREREEKAGKYGKSRSTYGDPGPLDPAPIKEWKPRARKAVFRWARERVDWRADYYTRKKGDIPMRHEVPAADLLNYSAYTPGDFVQFFVDPRTRANYMAWAPKLLRMERWYQQKTAFEHKCPACGGDTREYGTGRSSRGSDMDRTWMGKARCEDCSHISEYDTGELVEDRNDG